MKTLSKAISASILLSSMIASQASIAHSRYMLPSHTSLSGEDAEMVSLDLSVTNDLFHPDRSYGGKPLDGQETNSRRGSTDIKVVITAPDGIKMDAPALTNLGRKSATYANLEQNGTYKMTVTTEPSERTSYQKADGSRGRSDGLKQDIHLPEGATEVQSYVSGSKVETFVTRNDLSDTVLEPQGEGIELVGGTHPNDLFVGEEIEFKFLMQGKPVAEGTEVVIMLGGTRHRNERAEIKPVVDAKGMIRFTFPTAGFYFLEMSAEQDVKDKGYDYDSYSYSATFEVWPE